MTSPTTPRLPRPQLEGKRVLITGGGGFIGAALAEQLVARNQVVLFDHMIDGGPASLSSAWGHPNLEWLTGNVLDTEQVAAAADDVDVIVHLAAVVGVRNVLARGRETIETNLIGTSHVLRAAATKRSLHRFVYLSTSEVYGLNSFRATEATPASVGAVTEARWTYSIAKLAGEHLVHAYHRECGLPTVIVRPFNVFGPRRLGDHAVLRFIVAALRGEDLEVHGDGTQIRSWCYIDDFVDALLRVLALDSAIGESFNIGNSRNTVTIYDLAMRIKALVDSPSKVRLTAIDFTDIDVRVPSLRKAQALLGYEPRVELDEAIARTVSWYRANLARVGAFH